MIRIHADYQNKLIYRNLRFASRFALISFVLSLAASFCALICLIIKPSIIPVSEYAPFYTIIVLMFFISSPASLIKENLNSGLTSVRYNKKMLTNLSDPDYPAHNDTRMILYSFYFAIFPLIATATATPFVLCFKLGFNLLYALYLCLFVLHSPLYVGCFYLLKSKALIKRDPIWSKEEKAIIANKAQYDFNLARSEQIKKDDRIRAQLNNQADQLLKGCGFKFFLKYHKQIRVFSLKDIDINENYSPAEKNARYTAAKKIIEENLTKVAARIILSKKEYLKPSEVQAAQEILDS